MEGDSDKVTFGHKPKEPRKQYLGENVLVEGKVQWWVCV